MDRPDPPCNCLACTRYRQHPCVGKKRAEQHMAEVTILKTPVQTSPLSRTSPAEPPHSLSRSSEEITLLIGPTEIAFTAPKLLLSYYSHLFDDLIFSGAPSTPPLRLPDLDPHEFQLFHTWLTTGSIPWLRLTSSPELENLWVLGRHLSAPAFQNSVMYLIFQDYDSWSLNAELASYSFSYTLPDDKLRLFMVDLILSNGPFSEKSNLTEERRNWVEMLGRGGEVVRCLVGKGGWDKCGGLEPMMCGEWGRYLENDDRGEREGEGPGAWRRERVEGVVEEEEEAVQEDSVEMEVEEQVELPMRVPRSGKRV